MGLEITDRFDEAVHAMGLGRRYRVNASEWPNSLVAQVESLARFIRDELAQEVPAGVAVPDILVGVVDDPSFNAHAFLHDGHPVVGINYGALILVHALSQRLFSQRDFCRWVGDARKEEAAREFTPLCDDARTYMRAVIKDRTGTRPVDQDRRKAAELLAGLATHFLVAHEMGHILCGHLGWLNQHGCFEAAEATALLDDSSRALSSQALEWDADAFAMHNVLGLTLALADGAEASDPTLPGPKIVRTPEEALQIAMLCGMVMLGVFLPPAPAVDEWSLLSHPPAGVRVGLHMLAAHQSLLVGGRTTVISTTTDRPGWAVGFSQMIFRNIWRALGQADRDDELRSSFGPSGQDHLKKIMEQWAQIYPEVRRYSYFGVDATATPAWKKGSRGSRTSVGVVGAPRRTP